MLGRGSQSARCQVRDKTEWQAPFSGGNIETDSRDRLRFCISGSRSGRAWRSEKVVTEV